MANTFSLISSVTVGSGGASSIDFTSIPSTYTDLVLKLSGRSTSSSDDLFYIGFNSSTSNFSYRALYGTGSATGSVNDVVGLAGWQDNASDTASTFGNAEIYIPNYAGSNYKSSSIDSVSERNATNAETAFVASLWSNTAAITSIQLTCGAGNFAQYSTAYLYGIKNS